MAHKEASENFSEASLWQNLFSKSADKNNRVLSFLAKKEEHTSINKALNFLYIHSKIQRYGFSWQVGSTEHLD